jgi:hypothetical protein
MNSQAKVMLGGDYYRRNFLDSNQPASIQEYEYFMNLPPENQEMYLKIKRKQPDLRLETLQLPDGSEMTVIADPASAAIYDLQTGQLINRPVAQPAPSRQGAGTMPAGQRPDMQGAQLAPEGQQPAGLPPGAGRGPSLAEQTRIKAETAADVAREQGREKQVDSALQSINAGLSLQPVIQRAIDNTNWMTAGWGSLLSWIPGGLSGDLESDLATIKANLGFDRLQQMRESSPTGGALGAVSERELRALESTLRSLDQSQSVDQLKGNLRDVLVQYQRWMDAYARDIAEYGTRDQFAEYYDMLPPGSQYYHPTTKQRMRKRE